MHSFDLGEAGVMHLAQTMSFSALQLLHASARVTFSYHPHSDEYIQI